MHLAKVDLETHKKRIDTASSITLRHRSIDMTYTEPYGMRHLEEGHLALLNHKEMKSWECIRALMALDDGPLWEGENLVSLRSVM